MEPLSAAAIAIAGIIVTKTFEKTGEKLGEVFTNQVGQLIKMLHGKPSLDIVTSEQNGKQVSYGKAVSALEAATQSDVELNETVSALAETVKAEPLLFEKIQATSQAIQSEPSIINNYSKLADKIGAVVQPGASATFGDINL